MMHQNNLLVKRGSRSATRDVPTLLTSVPSLFFELSLLVLSLMAVLTKQANKPIAIFHHTMQIFVIYMKNYYI